MNKADIVRKITLKAQKQFPELKGTKPKIRWNTDSANKKTCTLTFETTLITSTGSTMYRRVKVVGDEEGNILKTTSTK